MEPYLHCPMHVFISWCLINLHVFAGSDILRAATMKGNLLVFDAV
jgi:hypothetical protein